MNEKLEKQEQINVNDIEYYLHLDENIKIALEGLNKNISISEFYWPSFNDEGEWLTLKHTIKLKTIYEILKGEKIIIEKVKYDNFENELKQKIYNDIENKVYNDLCEKIKEKDKYIKNSDDDIRRLSNRILILSEENRKLKAAIKIIKEE